MPEVLSKDEPQLVLYQVLRDKLDDGGSGLDDLELVVAPLEWYAEFQEDEVEDLNTQGCSLVPSGEDDKFQEEEPQVNQVELDQQEMSYVPIPMVV